MEPQEITEALINLVSMRALLAEAGMAKALRAKKAGHNVGKEIARQIHKAHISNEKLKTYAGITKGAYERQQNYSSSGMKELADLAGEIGSEMSRVAYAEHNRYNSHNSNVRHLGGQHPYH